MNTKHGESHCSLASSAAASHGVALGQNGTGEASPRVRSIEHRINESRQHACVVGCRALRAPEMNHREILGSSAKPTVACNGGQQHKFP